MTSDSDKKKYDRQLRIWGAHGQKRLENARVCLLNAGPTGSETLKNLVLGGIAAFTIVDDAQVQASDLGNNFLLVASNLGRSRAECVTEHLKELNPSVSGSFVEDSAATLLDSRADFFKEFELVIAAQVGERTAVDLDKICRIHGSKLIVARSYGLVGYLRPSLAEHQIIESKPDYPEEDLRLHRPWQALEDWAVQIDLSKLEDAAHSHVPYAALLIQAVKTWHASHGQKLPSTTAEKTAFKEIIKSWQHRIDGVPVEEENFSEALESRRLYKIFSPPRLPQEVKEIINDPAASISGAEADDFWILVAALKRFVENEGEGSLPLEGSIPDMTATTAMYLELQRIFRERADGDVAHLEAHVRQVEMAMGRSPRLQLGAIRFFAKHARNIRLVRYMSLEEETAGKGSHAVRSAFEREDVKVNAALYLLLRAADRFQAAYNRFPGSFDDGVEEDVALLKAIAAGVASEAALPGGAIPDDYVGEIVRFGACELHCVAAVIGGVAAQEAIKLLTRQFVPLKGTMIYNAMAGTSAVFEC